MVGGPHKPFRSQAVGNYQIRGRTLKNNQCNTQTKNKVQNNTMMALKSILIIFGIIAVIAIEASSVKYIYWPSKQQKRSFGFNQEANVHDFKVKRSQIHQHLRRALNPGTIERIEAQNISEVPELYLDEVTKQLDEDDYNKALDDIKNPEKEFAQVTLSKPNRVVRVLSQLMKDISWSEFLENAQKMNPNVSLGHLYKSRETFQNDGQTSFGDY